MEKVTLNFPKNQLGFIEQNWICESKKDARMCSNISNADAKNVLKGTCTSNVNK